jgi:Zn-dependent peptidase ImmA (M78 family)
VPQAVSSCFIRLFAASWAWLQANEMTTCQSQAQSQFTGKSISLRNPWALQTSGIRQIPFDELNGNMQGYSEGRNIAINPVAVNSDKTWFHELGHVVLGHTLAGALEEYTTHRGIFEFQAEATAYLASHELQQLDETTAIRSR